MLVKDLLSQKIEKKKAGIEMLKREVIELENQKATSKEGIEQWLDYRFESSCSTTEELRAFARDFKKAVKGSLPVGCVLADWNRGHFEVFGFISKNGKYVYFSISDVRFWQNEWHDNILIRTAKDIKDYTGGSNCYTSLKDFKANVERLLN